MFISEGWAEPVQEDAPACARALVLVVDDETDLRQFTTTLLTCNGYEVVEAQHGREAIARLCEHCPDLVILDLNMPVMDGWQFCAEQQRLSDGRLAATPVVLLTGTDGASGHATTLKAAGLVEKPFEPELLLAAIQTALQH